MRHSNTANLMRARKLAIRYIFNPLIIRKEKNTSSIIYIYIYNRIYIIYISHRGRYNFSRAFIFRIYIYML